tara:strand:- start:127 stop:474 length:348 start_codon:yes stop_codon:yes gene_type:complete
MSDSEKKRINLDEKIPSMKNKTLKDSYRGYFLDKVLNKYTDIESKESIMEVVMFFIYAYITLLFFSYSFAFLFFLFKETILSLWVSNFKSLFQLLLIIPSATILIRFFRTVFSKK